MKIFIFTLLFISQLVGSKMIAQVVVTSPTCTSLNVNASNLNYETNLIIAGGWKSCGTCYPNGCDSPLCSSPNYANPRHYLEKLNNQGSWISSSSIEHGVNYTFENLLPGTYRVRTDLPQRLIPIACGNDGIIVVNCTGSQVLGWRGEFAQSWAISDEIIVGPTQPGDIQWEYIDGDGINSGDNLFDFGEVIRINTEGTHNYDRWWLAISELNGPQRWKSTGWNFNEMPSEINLTDFGEIGGSKIYILIVFS